MSKKRAKNTGIGHVAGEPLYKLRIEAISETAGFLERLKSFIGLINVAELSNEYHTEIGTECLMYNRIKSEHLAKCLDINS